MNDDLITSALRAHRRDNRLQIVTTIARLFVEDARGCSDAALAALVARYRGYVDALEAIAEPARGADAEGE